ncbi:MAG TPA: tetratricopeptide repeat protein [Candidatus Nanopelagicales bacterium]|nr:tetratricopeptide repeat protein [Candidatus Nanopelagicales bacterium]
MRSIVAAALVALGLGGFGCSGRAPAMRPVAAPSSPAATTPSWVPPYTPAQLALLEPPDTPIQTPALRVFPDLGRFGYTGDHRMAELEESLRFTRMVVTILTDSPRFYVLSEIDPALANPVAQYGPSGPAEPDEWQIVQRDRHGVGRLSQAPQGAAVKAPHTRGEALLGTGDAPAARAAFEEALSLAPRHPAALIGLGRALVAAGAAADLAAAEAAFQRAIDVDPTLGSAHAGLAEIAERRGDITLARSHLAEALAYHPRSKRAWAIANRLTPGGAGQGRIEPFAIFLDVDSVGAVHVGAAPSGPAQVYAGCRAVLRYEPEVRAAIFKQPAGTPYYLSVVEEVVCFEAAIGAYLVEQADAAKQADPTTPREPERRAESDPRIEALARLAHQEGLNGYVMFEILGMHRPERARGAPPDLHAALVRYIEQHVFGQGAALPEGVYMARLDRR